MKMRLTNYLVSVLATAMIMTSLPVNLLMAQAETKEKSSTEETVSGADVNECFYSEVCDFEEMNCEELTNYNASENKVLSGTLGNNDGFSWSYDESTMTLTVTGEDSGLNNMRSVLPDTILENVKKIVFRNCTVRGSLYCLLKDLSNLEKVKFNKFDTSNVTDMGGMFEGCSSLTSVDVSGFDTSNVENMVAMFAMCSSLKNVDVSGFDTSNVTNMGSMFYGCSSLKNVDVSGFDTGNVLSMCSMFYGCSSLTSVDVSGFDTGKVFLMGPMFCGCSSLTSVDVSGFDTSNVGTMNGMFALCRSLENVDVSGFDTSNVGTMDGMFMWCISLKSVDLSGFDTSKVRDTSRMFYFCINLETIKTPKTMATDQIIELPSAFYDSKMNSITDITQEHCNKTLVKNIYYTIKFNKNGATSGKMSAMTNCKYGTTYTLNSNNFKCKGYTFAGWNTKADGSGKSYKNEASVKNLTSKSGKTVTLYAQWKKATYKITYKLNGGKNNKNNPANYTMTTATTNLKKPTRTGYTFAGWYSDSKYKTKVTQIKKGSTGNKTLYAKWTPIKYTIKFNGNGATGGKMSNLTNRKYGTSYKLTANAYEKKGYEFVGWNTRKNGEGKTYKNKASVKNLVSANGKSITLYAQWKKQ